MNKVLKKILLLFCLFMVFLCPIKAQFFDDFSDGDFSENPTWNGAIDCFQVNSNAQLQLNAPETGTACLSTFNQRIENTEWQFWIQLNFSPSNNNFARIYLASDQENLLSPLNGYFLQFGEALANDAVELYRQNGEEKTLICRGADGMIASSFAIRIKVTHTETGFWRIFTDVSGGTVFTEIASGTDQTITDCQFFGISCKYTSGNINRFFFDDFYVGDEIIDTEPPQIESLKAIADNAVEIVFNENITQNSATDINHYQIATNQLHPTVATLQSDGKTVLLSFNFQFTGNQIYTLNIQNIEDLSGNVAIDLSGDFLWTIYSNSDIIFNEIFADPTPIVGLPEWEYIELMNRTSQSISLNNWNLTIGTTSKTITEATIIPNGYLILCNSNAVAELSVYGTCYGFSSFSLTNSGQTLVLSDNQDVVISKVSYSDTWYGDQQKKEGGWSLERIDPENYCGTKNNWSASIHLKGGTPGSINSVFSSVADTVKPILAEVEYINEMRIMLNFSESIDTVGVTEIAHWQVDHNLAIAQIQLMETDFSAISIVFSEALQDNEIYTITVTTDLITDCYGNALEKGSSLQFKKQNEVAPFDVVINEIMADPSPVVGMPEYEFIELYNRTNSSINLTGWTLSIGTIINTFSNNSIPALGYLILCHADAENELEVYGKTAAIISSKTALTNSGQSLILRNAQNNIISHITYSEKWYKDYLKKDGGWSLEQIDPENYCGTMHNWTASIDADGATPGRENSVFAENPDDEIPLLLRAEFLSNNQISVYFNKPMNAQSVSKIENWNVDQGLQIAGIFPNEPDYVSTQIIFSTPLSENKIYTLSVETDSIIDCSGIILEKNSSVQFAKPEAVENNDIVINEILHHPRLDGVQYVELFNKSDKILDIKYLRFIFEKTTGSDSVHCTLPSFLLFPQTFCVLTKSPTAVEMQYHAPYPESFLTVSNFPTLIAAEGIVRITKLEDISQEIDAVRYSNDMHAALLNSDDGVSLERIHPNRPSNDVTNWHSAAELAGFGTPGYQNSQFDDGSIDDNTITVDPEIFTPNNDGWDDYLNIRYHFDEAGYTMNVYIFDARGSRIRHLINNELTGTEGAFSWDGKNESGQLCNAGIYILYVEVFDLNGHVKRFKKTGTLGVKF